MQAHGGDIYATARRMGWDWRDILDLRASINPLGLPATVRREIPKALERVVHYPELGAPGLRVAVAQRWGITEDEVLVGNGATDLLHFLIRRLAPSKTLLIVPTFSEFRRALEGSVVMPW